jgi:hypothetical protein
MKNCFIVFVMVSVFGLGCACTAQTSKRQFKEFDFDGRKINYVITLPSSFDPEKTYPLAIGPSDARNVDDQSYYWRETSDTYGWILIDFPLHEGEKNKLAVSSLLATLNNQYKVEGRKFHAICFSANSANTFDLVMATPESFHSIMGVAGNPGTRDIAKLSKLKNVKVRFVVGDQDSYWMSAAKDRNARLKEAGVDSEIEIIKDGQHVLKQFIGNGILSRMDKVRQL